jgi:hypothetical protein
MTRTSPNGSQGIERKFSVPDKPLGLKRKEREMEIDTRNVPGHRDAGPAHHHFLGKGCIECDAYVLTLHPWERVEEWHHDGTIDRDTFDAYSHVWLTSAYRFGNYAASEPTNERTWEVVRAIEAAMKARADAHEMRHGNYGRWSSGFKTCWCGESYYGNKCPKDVN